MLQVEDINLKEFESLSFKPDDQKGDEEYFTLGGHDPFKNQQKSSRESTSRSKIEQKDLLKKWEDINAFKKKSSQTQKHDKKSEKSNTNKNISGHLQAHVDPLQYESVDQPGLQTIEPQKSTPSILTSISKQSQLLF